VTNKVFNRVVETSSNTPSGASPQSISLSGTSPTMTFVGSGTAAGRKFVDVYGNGETCRAHIYETANPARWVVADVTFNTGSPNTLSLASANVLDGSAGLGAFPTWAGTVTCAVEWDALAMWSSYLAHRAHIDGGLLVYNSTTALDVQACTLAVNRKVLSTTSTTTITSGSTMKDLANSTVTIGANKAYFVFAYDNAGTLEFRVEERDGTGDGADPTWDTDYDYWKAASTGVTARRIGKFWTNGSSQILAFKVHREGLRNRFYSLGRNVVGLVTNGTSATYAAITLTPYITADDEFMEIHMKPGVSSGSLVLGNIFLSTDGGTNDRIVAQGVVFAVGTTTITGTNRIVNSGTLHYKTTATNGQANVDLCGFGHMV
jgi:hypothetical protein